MSYICFLKRLKRSSSEIKMEFQQQEEKPTLAGKLKRFGKECIRVLKVTKKPNKEEYKTIVKVSGLGIIIIGMIGFIIQIIKQLLF